MRIEFPDSVKPWRKPMAITSQEAKILDLGGMGYTDSRISFELGLARDVLASNWKKILTKLNAASRKEAITRYSERRANSKLGGAQSRPSARVDDSSDAIGDETRLVAQQSLLNAISDASLSYINGRQNVRHVYSRMLDALLALTQSQYGLIGEVFQEAGTPFLGAHALTSTDWDDVMQAQQELRTKDHLLFRDLDGLFGESIKTRDFTIVNDSSIDGRSGVTPPGHPEVRTFLGIPVCNGLDVVGIIGLANRPGGYSKETADFLKPIVSTCANITVAWRLETRRRIMERELDQANCMMRTLIDRTPSAVLYENADRRLEFVNSEFGELFGIEAAPAQLVGIDASLVVKHSARLFLDPVRFFNRVEDLIAGQESFYGELIEMTDGRMFLRDFVVVRSAASLCGYFWHYRSVATPFDE